MASRYWKHNFPTICFPGGREAIKRLLRTRFPFYDLAANVASVDEIERRIHAAAKFAIYLSLASFRNKFFCNASWFRWTFIFITLVVIVERFPRFHTSEFIAFISNANNKNICIWDGDACVYIFIYICMYIYWLKFTDANRDSYIFVTTYICVSYIIYVHVLIHNLFMG